MTTDHQDIRRLQSRRQRAAGTIWMAGSALSRPLLSPREHPRWAPDGVVYTWQGRPRAAGAASSLPSRAPPQGRSSTRLAVTLRGVAGHGGPACRPYSRGGPSAVAQHLSTSTSRRALRASPILSPLREGERETCDRRTAASFRGAVPSLLWFWSRGSPDFHFILNFLLWGLTGPCASGMPALPGWSPLCPAPQGLTQGAPWQSRQGCLKLPRGPDTHPG